MRYDLTSLLNDWPYEPGQLAVRVVQGDDGRSKIQLRLDLGILQMESEGRPDGQRPEGFESLLEYYEAVLDDHVASGNAPDDFTLDADACRRLREEAVQYYHRYVACFVLEDYDAVLRDTSRNQRVLEFCSAHAVEDDDREALEQFRPYVTMMRARALASQCLRDGEGKAALIAIDDGLGAIRQQYDAAGRPEEFEDSTEARLLNGMREALVPRLPVSERTELRNRLKQAVEQENYELAAILRDELRSMPEQ